MISFTQAALGTTVEVPTLEGEEILKIPPGTQTGEFFKIKRQETGKTMRKFCFEYGFDPGNVSKMERGLLSPPTSEEGLSKYAKALKIKKGSEDWHELTNRAFACRGEIPAEILSDDELMKKLPVFFRTLTGDKVATEKLKELAEIIRKS